MEGSSLVGEGVDLQRRFGGKWSGRRVGGPWRADLGLGRPTRGLFSFFVFSSAMGSVGWAEISLTRRSCSFLSFSFSVLPNISLLNTLSFIHVSYEFTYRPTLGYLGLYPRQDLKLLWRIWPICATEVFFKFQKKNASQIWPEVVLAGGGGRRWRREGGHWWMWWRSAVEERRRSLEEEEAAGGGGGEGHRRRSSPGWRR